MEAVVLDGKLAVTIRECVKNKPGSFSQEIISYVNKKGGDFHDSEIKRTIDELVAAGVLDEVNGGCFLGLNQGSF